MNHLAESKVLIPRINNRSPSHVFFISSELMSLCDLEAQCGALKGVGHAKRKNEITILLEPSVCRQIVPKLVL